MLWFPLSSNLTHRDLWRPPQLRDWVPALFEEFVTGLHFAFNGKAAGRVDMFIINGLVYGKILTGNHGFSHQIWSIYVHMVV